MKILLAGGGTLGSVKPLLSILEEAERQNRGWQWIWVGTKKGREKEMAVSRSISYEWLPVVKFRRYFAWQTLLEPFVLIFSFGRALFIINASKPDVIIGAGSFISVPVIWAGWLARKKIIIHQQDVRPTWSNKLCAWCADLITVSLVQSRADFPAAKTVVTGNPVGQDFERADPLAGRHFLGISSEKKIILILGGSSGAMFLNAWALRNLQNLLKLGQVVHITGKNTTGGKEQPGYSQFEFLDKELPNVMAAADLAVCRAGVSTLSELSFLRKPAILVPMPDSHQEDNAFYFADRQAAVVLRQSNFAAEGLDKIREVLTNNDLMSNLSDKIGSIMKHDARQKYIEMVAKLLSNHLT